MKIFESAPITINQLLDYEKLITLYYFDFADSDIFNIHIYFLKEYYDKETIIPALFENQKELNLKCEPDNENYSFIYEINRTFYEQNYEVTKDYQRYKIYLLSNNNDHFWN